MPSEETPGMTELLADEELVDFLKNEGVYDALAEAEKPAETIESKEESEIEEEAELLPEIELPQDLNLSITEEEV